MSKALDNIRVLDLTRLLPGPFAGAMLADFGAEVIRVEDPEGGDFLRMMPPRIKSDSALFMAVNRNKKSVCINLKTDEGRELFLELAKTADVVMEGNRPGVMDRLGVGYEALRKANPRLVYCAITGYGQDGPYRDKAGHDINYCGYAGLLSVTGKKATGPIMPGVQVADLAGGSLNAVIGILLALQARERTGAGQFVDISMTDGVLALLPFYAGEVLAGGAASGLEDFLLNGAVACYGVYRTADGKHLTLGALEPKFFQSFCKAVGRQDWIPRQMDQGAKKDALAAEIQALLETKTLEEWMRILEPADCCAGPVNGIDEALTDPQLTARGMVVDCLHPQHGVIKQVAQPIKLSETPANADKPAPALGQHTDEILGGVVNSPEKLAELKKKRVIR